MFGDMDNFLISLADYETKEEMPDQSPLYGPVEKCKNVRTGALVTVVYYSKGFQDTNVQKHYLSKVRTLSIMRHPATLGLIGFNLWPGEGRGPAFVTKYMINGSLSQVLDAERKGNPYRAWTATRKSICIFGIACAMRYIHSKNIIHRDFKPSKVLLDENWEPHVSGFGFSIRDNDHLSVATNIGTPLYMAPELADDEAEETYTAKIDVYAFGVSLYRFFTYTVTLDDNPKPFNSPQQYLQRISRGARFVRDPGISNFYWDLITACWHQNPELRPTFDTIVQLLKDHQEDYSIPGSDLDELERYENKVLVSVP
jgi:serine/threonine protein kinase